MDQGRVGTAGFGPNSNYGRQNHKKQLEYDVEFKKEMNETISNLQRMPGFKNKIWDRVTEMHNNFEEEKGFNGLRAGEMAR